MFLPPLLVCLRLLRSARVITLALDTQLKTALYICIYLHFFSPYDFLQYFSEKKNGCSGEIIRNNDVAYYIFSVKIKAFSGYKCFKKFKFFGCLHCSLRRVKENDEKRA